MNHVWARFDSHRRKHAPCPTLCNYTSQPTYLFFATFLQSIKTLTDSSMSFRNNPVAIVLKLPPHFCDSESKMSHVNINTSDKWLSLFLHKRCLLCIEHYQLPAFAGIHLFMKTKTTLISSIPALHFFWGSCFKRYAANHSTGFSGRALTSSLIPSSILRNQVFITLEEQSLMCSC